MSTPRPPAQCGQIYIININNWENTIERFIGMVPDPILNLLSSFSLDLVIPDAQSKSIRANLSQTVNQTLG